MRLKLYYLHEIVHGNLLSFELLKQLRILPYSKKNGVKPVGLLVVAQ